MIAGLPARSRLWVALVAAYVLVLQGMLGGVLASRLVGEQSLDRSLHSSLCAPEFSEPAAPDRSAGHEHSPSCCLPGCSMMGGTPVLAPNPPGVPAFAALAVAGAPVIVRAAIRDERPPLSPRQPRAPPLQV